ncbi:MAG: N-acetylmuramoyl-L-alanine amidase-like domain-containing protein [Alloprevotella sp.]
MRKSFFLFSFALCLMCSCSSGKAARPSAHEAEDSSVCVTDSSAETSVSNENAVEIDYTRADSLRVVELLKLQQPSDETSDVLFIARQFLGTPYVGATLEKPGEERLVVNLRQLDCTTFVETVCALVQTRRDGSVSFADYCAHLRNLRYRDGRCAILSRLHYFSWWTADKVERGLMTPVRFPESLVEKHRFVVSYMSDHPDAYPFLKNNPERTDSIRLMERETPADGIMLPQRHTALSALKLKSIADGDVIGVITTKAGLDYAHVGFAVWGKDGKLHLLHASSQFHKVLETSETLHDYLTRRSSFLGIGAWRLK